MNSRIEIDLPDTDPDTLLQVVRAVRDALETTDAHTWSLNLLDDLELDSWDNWDPQDISDDFLTESEDAIVGRLVDGFFAAKEQA